MKPGLSASVARWLRTAWPGALFALMGRRAVNEATAAANEAAEAVAAAQAPAATAPAPAADAVAVRVICQSRGAAVVRRALINHISTIS